MIEQTIIAICGMASIWLANDPREHWRRWACLIGLVAQPFWMYATWIAGQWGIFALSFVYAAGLSHVRLHDLRHTVGSLLAESGASLRDIQVWLGHTSPVTSTRYTHVELARLRAVADLVGARNLRAKHSAKGAQQAPVTRETPRDTATK